MNPCRTSLVALVLLSILSLVDISFALSCGSVECLNGGTCALEGGSGMGISSTMDGLAPDASGEAMVCDCAQGFTGPDCSEVECSIANCTKCAVNGTTCEECQAGFSPSSNKSTCELEECSVRNCSMCITSSTTCEQCNDGYEFVENQNECMLECLVRNCSRCNMDRQNRCQMCEAGFNLTKDSQCERECSVNNCLSCTNNSGECGECMTGFQLDNGQCECRIEGCKVCDSTMESCNECSEENAKFDQNSKSCIVEEPMDGQSIKVIVIIICALVAAVIVAIVVCIVSGLVYYRRRKRNRMFKLEYEVARSDSAELFDRIHTTFSVPAENKCTTDTSTDTLNDQDTKAGEGDASKDDMYETKQAEAEVSIDEMAEAEVSTDETKKDEAEASTDEIKKGEAEASNKDETKKGGKGDESKDDSKTTLANGETSREETIVAVAEDKSKETRV